jgi:hypothetical protein
MQADDPRRRRNPARTGPEYDPPVVLIVVGTDVHLETAKRHVLRAAGCEVIAAPPMTANRRQSPFTAAFGAASALTLTPAWRDRSAPLRPDGRALVGHTLSARSDSNAQCSSTSAQGEQP